jgi:hypothetical protein
MASSPEPQQVEYKYRHDGGSAPPAIFCEMTETQERRTLNRVQSEIDIGVLEPSARAPKRPRRSMEDERQVIILDRHIIYIYTTAGVCDSL